MQHVALAYFVVMTGERIGSLFVINVGKTYAVCSEMHGIRHRTIKSDVDHDTVQPSTCVPQGLHLGGALFQFKAREQEATKNVTSFLGQINL